MLPEISVNTFLPVAIATGTATFIGRLFFGAQPAFDVPRTSRHCRQMRRSADAAAALRRAGRGRWRRGGSVRPGPALGRGSVRQDPGRYLRHMLGMLLVGVLIYALMRSGGHYYVEGVGYATIQATLIGQLTGGMVPVAAVRLQAVGDVAEPRLRLVGRHLLAVAVHGRDARRRIRRSGQRHCPVDADQRAALRHGRHGGDGRRRHRRRDDRGRHGVRDDARLRHRLADDHGGRGRRSACAGCCRARTSTR